MVTEHSSERAWRGKRVVRLAAASLIAAAVTVLLLSPSPSRANCYELIGCTHKDYFKAYKLKKLSCQILWEVRNTIYKENGYCFHTAKGIKFFGNAGCKYDDAGAVPLNKAESYNVNAIKKVEQKKGCL